MKYEDIVRKERARRNTSYLEIHEMTRAELLSERESNEGLLLRYLELAQMCRERIALCSAELSKPNRFKGIEGGGKTTPRKKICRIHQWDPVTNKRIRGHKHDWRHPAFKGNL